MELRQSFNGCFSSLTASMYVWGLLMMTLAARSTRESGEFSSQTVCDSGGFIRVALEITLRWPNRRRCRRWPGTGCGSGSGRRTWSASPHWSWPQNAQSKQIVQSSAATNSLNRSKFRRSAGLIYLPYLYLFPSARKSTIFFSAEAALRSLRRETSGTREAAL